MNSIDEVIEYFKENSSEKYKENVVKLGIPEKNTLGVSINKLRGLAKTIKKSNYLAKQLWESGYHEGKLLSILIVDIYSVEPKWAISLIKDVVSWDLCDHLCKNLLFYLPEYKDLIITWQNDERLYYKRAAFSLITTSIIHDKNLNIKDIEEYLEIIKNHESDSRIHVRKAISWALREIGKKNIDSHKKAKLTAKKLIESVDKNKQWIGKNALKELDQLIAIKERKRLISKKSKMGKLYLEQTKTSS